MKYYLSMKSLKNLEGVHPDLVKVVKKVVEESPYDFVITEGIRTLEKQKQLFTAGKSKTMKSRHLTGHAIDFAVLVGQNVVWDMEYYKKVAEAFLAAGKALKIDVECGAFWKEFPDGPHVQLTWKSYP